MQNVGITFSAPSSRTEKDVRHGGPHAYPGFLLKKHSATVVWRLQVAPSAAALLTR